MIIFARLFMSNFVKKPLHKLKFYTE
jgi:hypothetical protein